MTERGCHAYRCHGAATVEFFCRSHTTGRWTSGGLYYCDQHGEKLAASWKAQGLDVLLSGIGVDAQEIQAILGTQPGGQP